MEGTKPVKQMVDLFREGCKTVRSTLLVFPGTDHDKTRNIEKLYESPDELGYELKA